MDAAGKGNSEKPLLDPLTRREQEILGLLAEGLTGGEMAERLTLAVSSVRWYVQQIYGKLGVNSKRQAISRANELGLLQQDLPHQPVSPKLVPEILASSGKVARPNNLPLQLTSFVGREMETETVCEFVRQNRLVTVTGSGGVGKTRLSIQVARQLLEESPNGVWYVDLAPISDPDLVPQIVVTTLGLQGDSKQHLIDILSRFLSSRDLLIVLDNCEHLLDACARLADDLLRKAPRLKILASSREALGIGGEFAYRVPSMTIPDPQHLPEPLDLQEYEAVRLFTERARTVLPTFSVDEGNAHAIARICQRLDGIPLAIELAAARLNLLSPEQLAGRLDSAFRLLTGGSRTALPRQQTLRSTIDWSYDLLSAPEQILLRRMAVFAGGSALEAIEAVCSGDGLETDRILDLLSGLVNKSMVNAEYKQPEETRYRLLETVRQYARERLYEAKESQDFFDRHLDYYLDLAETIESQLRTPAALEGLHKLGREADNLRSALSWALGDSGSVKIEPGLRLANSLLEFWNLKSFYSEGLSWLNKGLSTLADHPVAPNVRAKACFAAGCLLAWIGQFAEAKMRFNECLSIYRSIDDKKGEVMALSLLGNVFAWTGLFDQANQISTESLAISRTLNDAWLLAWVLKCSGDTLFLQNERLLAQPFYEESATIFEQLGDPLHMMGSNTSFGQIKFDQGDFIGARDYYTKAFVSAQAMQFKSVEAHCLNSLGIVAYMQSDYQQMQRDHLESVKLMRESGSVILGDALLLLGIAEINLAHPRQAAPLFKECLQLAWVSENYADNPLFENVAAALIGIGRTALQTDHAREAVHLLVAGKRLINPEKHLFGSIEQKEYERGWAEAKDRLGVIRFEQARSEGEALTLKEAVALALNLDL